MTADIVKLYFEEIKRKRGLSKDETRKVAIKAQGGDIEALKLLTENHLMLVAKIARRYVNMGVDFADLIAEGNIGLLNALPKWDPNGGSSFTTVASWWIKQGIIRNCMHNNRIVRLPEHISELMRDGRIPYTYSELKIDKMNDDGKDMSDTLPSDDRDIFADESELIIKKKAEKFLECLKTKEKLVIELKFGLGNNEKHNTVEIAEQMSLTTTRINQLFNSALKKMQEVREVEYPEPDSLKTILHEN